MEEIGVANLVVTTAYTFKECGGRRAFIIKQGRPMRDELAKLSVDKKTKQAVMPGEDYISRRRHLDLSALAVIELLVP
ncbi:hypothetical protein MUK42_37665 [Musa troglodytarum]|uniref:Uncharacterized protein n=1 Tax=Musa troglodytarum TaxID=320322 RepID=A0A9E7L6C8_9LILI|nr:hypothetical protein MUK42_37665 [Musa troglodytarum]